MVRWDVYGVCKDGVVLRARDEKLGVTGILRWRHLFSRRWRLDHRQRMLAALAQMHREMTEPSRNQKKRMRRRGQ